MEKDNSIYLQLGDIIQIDAPSNPDINQHNFLIDYIDSKKIIVIDELSGEKIKLNINEDGNLTDESISSITILDRPENKGYARQNNLLPETFIDIHFGGDLPITITGQITNLEEDMIEVKTYDDGELIYIDFAYKGIPDELPIDKIVIRPPPEQKESSKIIEEEEKDITPDIEDLESPIIQVPTETIKDKIRDIIIEADAIEFGPVIGDISQVVEVDEERKRFSLDSQVNDLLDELLASYPSAERTRKVLNNIHIQIERFKQLREKFSQFDQNGNATMPLKKGAEFKPLVKHLQQLNQNLFWILPVAQNQKKLYDIDFDIDNQDSIPDVIDLTLADTRNNEYDIRELYKSNTDNFNNYMRKLNPYLTPFSSIEYNDSLTVQQINDNITAVIDNLNDFYSSVFTKGNVKSKRFLISKYNLGLKRLQTTYVTSTVLKTKPVPLTNNDTISVKGFITLPKPLMSFSNVNLPSTPIYNKANLNRNFINYWKLFRENMKYNTKYIEDINQPLEFDENEYLKEATQYLLAEKNTDPDKYQKYLNAIIPKTRVLFNLVKKYIDGKLTLVSVIDYLQPFLIYLDDISYKQYEEINEFIESKILEYKKQYFKNKDQFNALSKNITDFKYESILYKILKGRLELSGLIMDFYGFDVNYKYKGNTAQEYILSNSEILRKMMITDNTLLYNTTLTLLNLDLYTPFDFDLLFDQKKNEFEVNLKKEAIENECKQYVLTKRYIDLTDLLEDNEIPVYFDKKYDPTVYDIINEYQMEQSQMDDKTFKNFLTEKLIQNIGLNKSDAKYEATSMIEGKRKVQDDQYAVLEIDNIDSVKYFYYKRENEKWVKDESISPNSFYGTSELFCNVQNKCININDTCADTSFASELVRTNLLKQMEEEFDNQYEEDMNKYKKKINKKFKLATERIKRLKAINNFLLFKYELKHLAYSQDVEEEDIITSPFYQIRDTILGQSDIVKRNTDIVKFVKKATRTHIESLDESPYWLYCIETNTQLLPTFISTLASVFIMNGDYQETLNIIKKEQGANIDNITWCKYTGYMIEKIALNTEEEFEESGYRIVSRDILEMDAGAALLQSATVEQPQLLTNPKAKLINNVITLIAQKLGLILDDLRENIINHTLIALEETVDSIEVFEEKQKTKKKKQSYEDVFNASLLTFTLSYISLFISVSVPSLQSKKTFPGCKKSFQGYPVTGDEDLSNIEYIACIAASIESKTYPWKSLPKNKEKIKLSLKKTFDAYILKKTEIQALIEQKKNYLIQNEGDEIPIELDIKRWMNFLPPLQKIEQKTPANLSTEFRNSFKENIKTGSKNQFEQIYTINCKIIYFSMAIMKAINQVVEKEKLLLTNSANTPFLQNACCNTSDYNTINYFVNKDKNIDLYNGIVNYLYNIVFDVRNMTQPALLLDAVDTKIKFPPLSNEYSEDTIYKAFIEYCNFNNNIPINDKLISICLNKPDEFDKSASIKDKIELLKKEGKIYSIEAFNELILEVSKMNVVNLDLVHNDISNIQQMRDLITNIKDSDNMIDKEFLNLLIDTLDSYSITSEGEGSSRELKNWLGNNIEILNNKIADFISKYSSESSTEKKKIVECIFKLVEFNKIGNNYFVNEDDETLYKAILFIKNSLFAFIYIFPDIIMNKVDYQSIKIPSHWKLSENHVADVKEFIKNIYQPLRKFYNDDNIFPLLTKNQQELKNFYKLIELTNLYANIIKLNNTEIKSILDNRLVSQLFQFYILFVINQLIEQTDDISLISREQLSKKEVEDIITTDIVVKEELTGEITELDVVRGEQKNIKEKVASLIMTMFQMICKEKDKINVNGSMIKEKINRAKDKERHKITTTLKEMDKEERQIENLFKNHRLERWNKGQQKGLTQYVARTYDEERAQREADEILERQLEERELMGQARTADREIARFEEEENQLVENRINQEVDSLAEMPEDDDYGEDIDDGYALQFDDYEE